MPENLCCEGQVSYHWAREQMQLYVYHGPNIQQLLIFWSAGRTDLVAVAAQQPRMSSIG